MKLFFSNPLVLLSSLTAGLLGMAATTQVFATQVFTTESPPLCRFEIADGSYSMRQFSLNEQVYQCLDQDVEAQLLVVNADGQPVPFNLSKPATKSVQKLTEVTLNHYQEPAPFNFKTGNQIETIAALTALSSSRDSDAQWLAKNRNFLSLLVEYPQKKPAPSSLKVHFAEPASGLRTFVMAESSSDLKNWTARSRVQEMLYLSNGNGEMLANSLDIYPHRAERYYRLSFISNTTNLNSLVRRVSGHYPETEITAPELIWTAPASSEKTALKNRWQITMPASLPFSEIRFSLPGQIAVHSGTLFTEHPVSPRRYDTPTTRKKLKAKIKESLQSPTEEQPTTYRRKVSDFLQYRLQTEDGTQTSANIAITETRHANWQVEYNSPSALADDQIPQIEMGWAADQIAFIAQGSAPFALLVAKPEETTQQIPPELLQANPKREMVSLVDERTAPTTGKQQGTSSPTSPGWMTLALWALLLAAVGFLIKIALQLKRQISEEDGV